MDLLPVAAALVPVPVPGYGMAGTGGCRNPPVPDPCPVGTVAAAAGRNESRGPREPKAASMALIV